jgi:orotate phosphoribosyltransferase-like protein
LAAKIELIKQVKKLHGNCISKREIARRLNLDFSTVSKYIELECILEKKVIRRSSIIDPFIKELFNSGMKASYIHKILSKQ